MDNIQYDLNGNITDFERMGVTGFDQGQYTYGMMDNLDYSYDGNQLKTVNDIIADPSFTGNDFRDNNSTGSNEYQYDANGNMVSDANKGITVTYNQLNLPEIVDFGNNNKIMYLYTSTGKRIKKSMVTGPATLVQHYAGNIVYKENELELIQTSEGRVKKEGTNFNYEYFMKDHLGNVRVVFGADASGNAEILQEDHYYPFGLTYMGDLNYNYGTEENKYLYQGKELQDEHNLNWMDFGARMYDPQIGRWHCADPAGQFASPYLAMGNNPINAVDPNGMWIRGSVVDYHNNLNWRMAAYSGEAYIQSQAMHGRSDDYWDGWGKYKYTGVDDYHFVERFEMSRVAFVLGANGQWAGQGEAEGFNAKTGNYNISEGSYTSYREGGHNSNDGLVTYNKTETYFLPDPIPLSIGGSSDGKLVVTHNTTYTVSGISIGGDQAGGGVNDGLTLNEAATGVSAMSLSNSIKGNLVEWGMKGADWGKTGARYMKAVRGAGIAGTVFGMGVSTYNIVSDVQAGNAVNSWDVADLSVGAAGLGATIFLASNPVGWVIAGGATIYFGARFVYDISTKP
ncbi:MAG: RHS repeat-associated core domain-containing protein [Bacteroidales bacterium]